MSGQLTPQFQFYLPDPGSQGWGESVNQNFTKLESLLSTYKKPGSVARDELDAATKALLASVVTDTTEFGGDLLGRAGSNRLRPIAGLTPGAYGLATVTVDAQGRVVGIAAGNANGGTPGAGAVGAEQLANGAVTTDRLRDGAVTDGKIGQRTVSDLGVPDSDTGVLSTLLGGLANRLRAITGLASWRGTPVTNLQELHDNVARKTASETVTRPWAFEQPLAVPAATTGSHAVNLAQLSAALNGSQNSVGGSLSALGQVVNQHTTQISDLTGAVAGKFDKTGGVISGPVSVVGALKVTGGSNASVTFGGSNAYRFTFDVAQPAEFTGASMFTFGGEVRAPTFRKSSSRALKHDVAAYTGDALSLLMDVDVVTFRYIEGAQDTHIGVIAEDVPEEISGRARDSMLLDNTVALLIRAVQQLTREVRG